MEINLNNAWIYTKNSKGEIIKSRGFYHEEYKCYALLGYVDNEWDYILDPDGIYYDSLEDAVKS